MSNLLADDTLPKQVQSVMDNRVGDCEICQDACPWNKKHLERPLVTKMTNHFQQQINNWGDAFYLPNLRRLSEINYNRMFDPIKTNIPYQVFRRNVLIAMEKAENLIEEPLYGLPLSRKNFSGGSEGK